MIQLVILAAATSLVTEPYPINIGHYRWPLGTPVSEQGDFLDGYAGVDLLVDPTGHVIACDVALPVRKSALGAWLCKGLSREAKFRPAIDQYGQRIHAVSRQWGGSVTPFAGTPDQTDIYLPVSPMPRRGSHAAASVRLVLAKTGAVEYCEIGKASTFPMLDRLACPTLSKERFQVGHDAVGAPVRTVRVVRVGFRPGSH